MGKPLEHAQNNVKKYGGKIEDYLHIHEMMDISKSGLGDKRHRAIFHNSTAVYTIIPKIFGSVLTNSDGNQIATSQIAEDHVLDDFGGKFVPSLQDWLREIPMRSWMDNGKGYPPSTTGAFERIERIPITKEQLDDIALDGASKYRDIIERPKLEEFFGRIPIKIDNISAKETDQVFFTSIGSD